MAMQSKEKLQSFLRGLSAEIQSLADEAVAATKERKRKTEKSRDEFSILVEKLRMAAHTSTVPAAKSELHSNASRPLPHPQHSFTASPAAYQSQSKDLPHDYLRGHSAPAAVGSSRSRPGAGTCSGNNGQEATSGRGEQSYQASVGSVPATSLGTVDSGNCHARHPPLGLMSNSSLARSGSSLMSDSSRPNIPHRSESATDHDRDRFGFTHQELLLRPPPQPGDLGQAEASGHSVPGAEGRAPSEPSATTQLPLRTALARDNATSPSHCTTTTQQALRTALEKFRPLCMPPEETVDYLLDSPDGLRLLANGEFADQEALRQCLLDMLYSRV